MEPVEITAGVLHLRPWRRSDAPAVAAACADPETQRWLPALPRPYTRADADQWCAETTAADWAADRAATWAVCAADTGDVVAALAVHLHPGRQASLGFWAVPAARNRGVVTAAAAAGCRWALQAVGVARLEWQAEVGNWPSRRVAEKVGFGALHTCRARLLDRAGRPVDAWVASLLPTAAPPGTGRAPAPPVAAPAATRSRADGAAVTLRPWRWADRDTYVTLRAEPALLARALPWPAARGDGAGTQPDAELHDFADRVHRGDPNGRRTHLAVTVDGEVVGGVRLSTVGQPPGWADVGAWLAGVARGRGTGAAVAAVLADHARARGLVALSATTATDNTAARRLLTACGAQADPAVAVGGWQRWLLPL